MRRLKPWTEMEEKKLVELYRQGLTRKEIAARLNRTIDSVNQKVKILGISRRHLKRWTEEELQVLKEWYSEGASIEDIAYTLDRTVQSILNKITALGLRRKGSDEVDQRARVLRLSQKRRIKIDAKELIRAITDRNRLIRCLKKELKEKEAELRRQQQELKTLYNQMRHLEERILSREEAEYVVDTISGVLIKIERKGRRN